MEGDRVTIVCAALSVPKPDDISWYYQGREVSVVQDQVCPWPIISLCKFTNHENLLSCSLLFDYPNVIQACYFLYRITPL